MSLGNVNRTIIINDIGTAYNNILISLYYIGDPRHMKEYIIIKAP